MSEFVQHTVSGTVHVTVPAEEREAWWRQPQRRAMYRRNGEDVAALEWAMVPCLCGALTRPCTGTPRPGEIGFYYVGVCDDDRLCRSCRRATLRPAGPPAGPPAVIDLDALLEVPGG